MPSYTVTDWVDNITPVNAANMDKMEAGIAAANAGALPADTVVAAPTRIISNKLSAGDAQPVCRLLGDGKIEWGAGGTTALDTNLYRSAAYTLRVSEMLEVGQSLSIGLNNNAYLSLKHDTAKIYFGSAADTNLYRSAADTLKTDDSFHVAGSTLGLLGSTYITQYAAASPSSPTLVTRVTGDANNRLLVSASGTISWGDGATAPDTSLYRAAADVLATDDRLQLAGTQSGSSAGSAIQIGVALPTYLQGYVGGSVHGIFSHNAYFGAADGWHWGTTHASFGSRIMLFNYGTGIEFYADGVATTAGASFVPSNRFTIYNTGGVRSWSQTESGSFLWLYGADANTARIYFNSAMDTNLYRAAADKLKTDDTFEALYLRSLANVYVDTSGSGGGTGIYFGPALDTNLYRYAANELKTDDGFRVIGNLWMDGTVNSAVISEKASLGVQWLASKIPGDANWRHTVDNAGAMVWGGGTSGWDVSLYRSGAGFLKATGSFQVGGDVEASQGAAGTVILTGGGGQPRINFGNALDTNLYRYAAGTLLTDGQLICTRAITTKSMNGQPLDTDVNYAGFGTMVWDDQYWKLWIRSWQGWKSVQFA